MIAVDGELKIRKYQPADRGACRRLWRELTEWHRQIYQDPSIGGAHPEDLFDKHLEEVGADRLWVAVLGSEVVGLIGLVVKKGEAEIEPLIVSQPYRRRGVGRRLVEAAVAEARRLGVRLISVKPVARNVEAMRFFHRQGFKTLGHVELILDLSGRVWKKGPELFGYQFYF